MLFILHDKLYKNAENRKNFFSTTHLIGYIDYIKE